MSDRNTFGFWRVVPRETPLESLSFFLGDVGVPRSLQNCKMQLSGNYSRSDFLSGGMYLEGSLAKTIANWKSLQDQGLDRFLLRPSSQGFPQEFAGGLAIQEYRCKLQEGFKKKVFILCFFCFLPPLAKIKAEMPIMLCFQMKVASQRPIRSAKQRLRFGDRHHFV